MLRWMPISVLHLSPLGMPSAKCVHDYYPFAMKDGARLNHVVMELVDCLVILVVVRCLSCFNEATSFRTTVHFSSYARLKEYICRPTYV
jgi:hypothetical protein